MIKIDSSQLNQYITCPRAYYYRYIECLRKISNQDRELDLNFGKCFHKAIEILYKENNLEKAKNTFRSEFNPIEAEKVKTPANGEKLVEAYRNYWSQPVNELSDTNLKTLGIELTDEFALNNDITWIVKVDRIASNGAGNWIVEAKTTTKIAYNYFRKFDLSMQISGYVEWCKRKYGQCSGAIINVASLGYRERKYMGEPAGFHCEFVREVVNRNEAQLADFRSQAIEWATRLTKDIQTSNDGLGLFAFPQATNACWGFRGCGFQELCKSCNDQSVKDVLYEKYDPTAYLKEEKVDD